MVDSLGRHLGQVHQPGPAGGLLERGPQVGVEPGQRVVQRLLGHPRGGQVHAVEPGRMLADRRAAAPPYVLADRPDRGQGRLHVQLGARQQAGQLAGAQLAGGLPAKIHSHQHASSLREPPARAAPAPVPAAASPRPVPRPHLTARHSAATLPASPASARPAPARRTTWLLHTTLLQRRGSNNHVAGVGPATGRRGPAGGAEAPDGASGASWDDQAPPAPGQRHAADAPGSNVAVFQRRPAGAPDASTRTSGIALAVGRTLAGAAPAARLTGTRRASA